MSITIDHGTTGVKRQSFRNATLRDTVAKILNKNPRISDDDLLEEVRPLVQKRAEYLDVALTYFLAGERRNLTRGPRETTPERKQEAADQQQALVERIKEIATPRIQKMVLDMMVDGKPLRDYTFGEVGKLGGKFTALSKGGKPNEKVGKLSETAVRKLFR